MASTVLLVPLVHIENIVHVVVVADMVMDGWGLVPHFLLFQVDCLLLMWW
jgi:hypothetical protein